MHFALFAELYLHYLLELQMLLLLLLVWVSWWIDAGREAFVLMTGTPWLLLLRVRGHLTCHSLSLCLGLTLSLDLSLNLSLDLGLKLLLLLHLGLGLSLSLSLWQLVPELGPGPELGPEPEPVVGAVAAAAVAVAVAAFVLTAAAAFLFGATGCRAIKTMNTQWEMKHYQRNSVSIRAGYINRFDSNSQTLDSILIYFNTVNYAGNVSFCTLL